MPFRYMVEADNCLISIIGTGIATMRERFDCVDSILCDENCCPGYRVLIDVTRVDNSPTADEMRVIVELLAKLKHRFAGRLAIFNTCVGNVTMSYIIALLAAENPGGVKAFVSEPDARAWLSVN